MKERFKEAQTMEEDHGVLDPVLVICDCIVTTKLENIISEICDMDRGAGLS